jgi:hypothetical protein
MPSRILIALAVSVALAACAAPLRIDSEQAPGADLARLRTYQWVSSGSAKEAAIREAVTPLVDRELQAKGYGPASGEPDFHVGSDFVVENKIQMATITTSLHGDPGSRAPGGAMGGHRVTTVREFSEGTLIITVVDPRSKAPVWRGWAETTLNPSAPPQQRAARLADAVAKILERFPSRR